MSDSNNPLRQDGGLPNLGLAEIDPRLDRPSKSVERISDPMARLVVLWTLIGQYEHAAIEADSEQDGALTVQSAQKFQLLSTWANETRRVVPQHRLESDRISVKNIFEKLQDDKPLAAYIELIDIRDWAPEMVHPDVRFDLFYAIWNHTEPLNDQDSFRDIVLRDMVGETMPGGIGYCDDTERLRRYEMLGNIDSNYLELVETYVKQRAVNSPSEYSEYFDGGEISISDVCGLIAERKYDRLSTHILNMGVVGIEDELTLLDALG